jgi:hypothetical protein
MNKQKGINMNLSDVKTQGDYIQWQSQEIERLHDVEKKLLSQIKGLFERSLRESKTWKFDPVTGQPLNTESDNVA